MKTFRADLHVHSRFSRATSGRLNVRNLAAVIVLLAAGLVLLRRSRELLRGWCTVFVRVATVFLALIGALGFAALVDFNRFWTLFHQIFFRNDLWLLNPATSVLIQMVPEAFFSAIVTKILIWFAVVMIIWFALAGLGLSVAKRRAKRKEQTDAAIVGH